MKPFLAQVVWYDAHQVLPNWNTLEELDEEPYQVRSCGWVLPDVKEGHVVLVQSIGAGEHYDAGIAIPLKMVKSIHRLRKDGKA